MCILSNQFHPVLYFLEKALKLIFGLFIRSLDNASKFANPGEVKTALDMCQKAEEIVERKISNREIKQVLRTPYFIPECGRGLAGM